MRAWGFSEEDFEAPPVVVWPDNQQAVMVMLAMRTQWRIGTAGRTGLDYAALAEVWQRLKVPEEQRDAVFLDLQVIEDAALEAMHEED